MGEWIAAVSVVVGVISWLISQEIDKRARRAAHTANFLAELSTNDGLAESNFRVNQFMEADKKIDPKSLDETLERHLIRLLNYYEYMSAFYFRGVLDKKLVKTLRVGPMARTYRACEEVIKVWRAQLKAPKLYEELEKFVGVVRS